MCCVVYVTLYAYNGDYADETLCTVARAIEALDEEPEYGTEGCTYFVGIEVVTPFGE